MGDSRWPLSAVATQVLLDLPRAGSRPRAIEPEVDTLKLALKELLARDALKMRVKPAGG